MYYSHNKAFNIMIRKQDKRVAVKLPFIISIDCLIISLLFPNELLIS